MSAPKTIYDLEVLQEEKIFETAFNYLSEDAGVPEDDQACFLRMYEDGYGQTMDELLVILYGDRELRPSVIKSFDQPYFHSVSEWWLSVWSYLKSHVELFKKAFKYIDAEYNPVENYMGEESETIINTIGERHRALTDTDEPRTIETNYDTPQHQKTVLTPQVTVTESSDSDIVKEKTELKSTTETKTAPFESSDYFNKDKVEVTPGKVTETEKPYERETATSEHTITETEVAHIDKVFEKHLADEVSTHETTEDEAEDVTERSFSRHGNIGVLSAGELMQKDLAFWKDFSWLRDSVHDVANLLSGGVWTL